MPKQSSKHIIDIPSGEAARAWSMRYVIEYAANASTQSSVSESPGLSESSEAFVRLAENAVTGKKPMRVQTKADGRFKVLRVGEFSLRASQHPKKPNSRKKITLARGEYDAMMERLDELEWAAAYAERKDAATFPTSVARRIVAGESPVRVFREHRELTQLELAKKSGVTQSYLAAIETGKKPGSASALKAIASALGIPMDVLVADD